MPAGWIHRTIDLLAYGRTYAHVHSQKDAASQTIPGMRHRTVGHEWYQRFGQDWDYTRPFPWVARESTEKIKDTCGPHRAEEYMSSLSHDWIDKTWDLLSREQRSYWEGFFAWLVYHPEILLHWADVDVERGRVRRIVNGNEIWSDEPEIAEEYKMVRREMSRHHKRRLRKVLERFG